MLFTSLRPASTPFRGDNEFATMARIRDKAPAQDPLAHVPDLPPALAEVMLHALGKRREERYETMLDFGRALEQALPSSPDVDRALGAFMGSVLSQRVAKREAAIREALRTVSNGADAQPVNFCSKPRVEKPDPSGIRPITAVVAREAAPASIPAPFAPPASAPAPPAARPAQSPDVDPDDLPEGMRPARSHTGKIVAAIVVVLSPRHRALGRRHGASGPEAPAPTKHAF